MLDPEAVASNVSIAVYGDDHWISVSDEYAPYVNMRSLARFSTMCGWIYKDVAAGKSEVARDFVERNEIIFLGRHPVHHRGTWLGRLDKNTISDILYWEGVRATQTDRIAAARTALMEAHRHGKQFYEQIRNWINTAVEGQPAWPPFPDYEHADATWETSYHGAYGSREFYNSTSPSQHWEKAKINH
jgi:hypothetical protein